MPTKRLPHTNDLYRKLIKSILLGPFIILISLSIGIIGYHYFFNVSWVDNLVNASMILTGMEPVDKAVSNGAKVFSSMYAIYSGVAFLTSVAVIFDPIVHRFLHKFRIDVEEN